jgi:hypothetical protein
MNISGNLELMVLKKIIIGNLELTVMKIKYGFSCIKVDGTKIEECRRKWSIDMQL